MGDMFHSNVNHYYFLICALQTLTSENKGILYKTFFLSLSVEDCLKQLLLTHFLTVFQELVAQCMRL